MRKFYSSGILLCLLLSLTLISNSSFAQGKKISGTIIDDSGQTLIGANVIIKGTSAGTVTDVDGNFELEASSEDVLIISYIGYNTETITVGDKTVLDITLYPDLTQLQEVVVVVGYGEIKKKDKTGAVAIIEEKDFNTGVLQDPIQAIQGKVAGLNITKKGGDPNAGFDVRLRGTAGLSSGTSPLYVVDNVPGVDPTTISPDEIASVNVLKDASATAIYGSRGANGVIIITTKKGNFNSKGTISYSGYYSMDRVAGKLDLFNADEIRQYATANGLSMDDQGANTDWQDAIFRTGTSQSHNVALSGGKDKSSFRASVNYQDFQGLVKGTDKERMVMRINANQKAINDKLELFATLTGTFENNNYVNIGGNNGEAVLYQAYTRNPTYPIYNPDGSYFEVSDFENSNPVALIEQIQNERQAKRYLANAGLNFELVDGLTYTVMGSYRFDDQQSWFHRPSFQITSSDGGLASRNYGSSSTKILETSFRYNKVFGDHDVKAVVGYSWQEDAGTGFGATGRDLISDFVRADNLRFANDVLPQDIYSYRDQSRLISFIGRVMYHYNSKYYLTGTIRRDGSSRFGANHEWGWFPSFSAGWDLSREDFMLGISWLDQLKLRAGYGIVGNQEIGNYNDIARVTAGGRTLDPITAEETIELIYASNANPNLKWEENSEVNIGIDFMGFGGRLNLTAEYYDKTTEDLLASYAVPVPPYPYNTILANAGTITNKGVEILLGGDIIQNNEFNWYSSLIFSRNKQMVESLSNENYNLEEMRVSYVSGRGMVGVWTQLVKPGMPLGTFYGWKYAGIDGDGKWWFQDRNGELTQDQLDEDRQEIGNALPDFTLSWTNTVNYKNWDLSFMFRGVFGNDVLNVTEMIMGNPNMLPNRNALKSAIEFNPPLNDAPKFSDYYLEDGSFVRLDNITLGYNFNTDNINWLGRARIYFSGNNLLLISGYSGIDPESNYGGFENLGIDMYDIYPKAKSFSVGVNLDF